MEQWAVTKHREWIALLRFLARLASGFDVVEELKRDRDLVRSGERLPKRERNFSIRCDHADAKSDPVGCENLRARAGA